MSSSRAVQTVAEDSGGVRWFGSGFQVAADLVLTANHVLHGCVSLAVRFVEAPGGVREVVADRVFWDAGVDVAVLRLREIGPDVTPVSFGVLVGSATCDVVGFPRFKLNDGRQDGRERYRDSHHAMGRCPVHSNMIDGTLELTVDPPERDPDLRRSPWEGMSGAAVFAEGLLIGVVTEHRRRDGLGRLTAIPVREWSRRLSSESWQELKELLGMPEEAGLGVAGAAPYESPEVRRKKEADTQALRERQTHFRPRARGAGTVADSGSYFTGRTAALADLASWLRAPAPDRHAVVVTGGPGSGKSALLGRLLDLADSDTVDSAPPPQTVPPGGCIDVIVHARGMSLEALVERLAAALSIACTTHEGLLLALKDRKQPVTVLIDSLDEAGGGGDQNEARRIGRELLNPMCVLPRLRLIIGTRTGPLASLDSAVRVINLDTDVYSDPADLTGYVRAMLLAEDDPDSLTPYRGRERYASQIAEGVAHRAGRSFLVARMIARALIHSPVLDVNDPGWEQRLPSEAGQAFDAYLGRFGPEEPLVRRLLLPLAYAAGQGLPWDDLWAKTAAALSGVHCTDQDIDWLLTHAGAYVAEIPTAGNRSVYRLFAESLAEHLRDPRRDTEVQRRLCTTLLQNVRARPASGGRDWAAADPYILDHLATHAVAAGVLDTLLDDTDYLTFATPQFLLHALNQARADIRGGRVLAAVYRASVNVHASVTPTERRDILAVDSARYQRPDLARAFAHTRPWRPRWATGGLVDPGHRMVLTGHTGPVRAVALGVVQGRPVAVTGGDDPVVRVWDLIDGTERATLASGATQVHAVAVGEWLGRPIAVIGDHDGTVRVWDLIDGTELLTLTGHTGPVRAVALCGLPHRQVVVTGGNDATVRVWSLIRGLELLTLTGHTGPVRAVAVDLAHGGPAAITASDTQPDRTVRTWDLFDGTELECADVSEPAVAVGVTDGGFVTLCGSDRRSVLVDEFMTIDGTTARPVPTVPGGWIGVVQGRLVAAASWGDRSVRVWDPVSGIERCMLTGHQKWVRAVVVGEVQGRSVAVAGSEDHTVRVWDLDEESSRTTRPGHDGSVRTVAAGVVKGRPVAVTGGEDRAVRVWDIRDGTPGAVGRHRFEVDAVATGVVQGHPVAIAAGDPAVRVWDLASESEHAPFGERALSVATCMLRGRPVAITGQSGGQAKVWDLTDGTERATFTGHTIQVNTVATGVVQGRPVAITGGADATVRVWDLLGGTERAVLTGHTDFVNAVATGVVRGRPVAVTGSNDATARVWDLISGSQRAVLTGHDYWVGAVAVGEINGRPIAVTTGGHRTVCVWDLETHARTATMRLPQGCEAVAILDNSIILGMGHEVLVLEPQPRR